MHNPAIKIFIIKISISLFLIFAIQETMGQDTARDRSIHFGLMAAPEYAYRKIDVSNDKSRDLAKIRDSLEIPKIGYSFGAFVLFQINHRLSVELGVLFSEKGERTINMDVKDTLDPTNPITKMRINYRTTFIDIPVKVKYYFSENYTSPFLSIGLSSNIFAFQKNSYNLTYTDNSKEKNSNILRGQQDFYRINPQVKIGMGFDFILYESRLQIEPSFALSLLNANKGDLRSKYYSIGLSFSYMINMKQREEKID